MKNSQEVLDKINKIEGLEDEVVTEVVIDDLKEKEILKIKKKYIESILGQVDGQKEEEIIKKLVEFYKKVPPYMGYCYKYWAVKKEILKEKYNIEWYSPSEENPENLYD